VDEGRDLFFPASRTDRAEHLLGRSELAVISLVVTGDSGQVGELEVNVGHRTGCPGRG
jgi:hypothetical protein